MDLTDADRPRLTRHVRLKFDPTREQYVLLSPETVWVLNETGSAIVRLCDGNRTVLEIQAELRARYDHVADDEVLRYVADLIPNRCMEVNHD